MPEATSGYGSGSSKTVSMHSLPFSNSRLTGWTAREIGYLGEYDVVHGLPLGPCTDMHWYSREVIGTMMTHDLW
jgi:hypothetical protein